MKVATLLILIFGSVHALVAGVPMLENVFRNPPPESRPWCYWYWINGNISKEGVTKDLEAMAEVGIGTALIGNQWFGNQPKGAAPVLSEAWWEITVHAVREGRRLGVDIGLFNCPGWSMSGGPWVQPEQAMRYLVSSEMRVAGGQTINSLPPVPGENFQDVALLAIPAVDEGDLALVERKAVITSRPELESLENVIDGDAKSDIAMLEGTSLELDITVEAAFTARSVTLIPGKGDFKSIIKIQAWIEGAYQTIREVNYDRRNRSLNVGPMPQGAVIVALPPTTSDRFRLIFSPAELLRSTRPIRLAEIEISPVARVEYAVEKQLGKMFPEPLPFWDSYIWPDPPEPDNSTFAVNPEHVIDLTGKSAFKLPAGDWIIQRIGMLPTGVRNSPAAPHASGLEVDKLNRKALAAHFDAFVGQLLHRLTPDERLGLKYIVGDSYEKGSQNWTDNFADVFQDTYGYNPVPFLPVLSGQIVSNADKSDRFLWDLRRLIADKVADEYVGGLRDLCNEHNMQLWLENYGHWGFPGEFMRYGGECDLVSGEFWVTGTLGNIECRAAASTAHAYGKPVVYAEAFTSHGNWHYAPFDLKARGDWAFTEGINHFVLHVYVQQPNESAPGMKAWFGTDFNRHNTWFFQGREWFDYLRRCHVMLQQGLHVADFVYFIGEDAPIMTGTRIPEQPAGYDFDYVNAEVILERMTVRDGRWTLPDGKSYAILVLPPLKTMRPAVLEKLDALVNAGGVLYGQPPERSPSMQNAEAADQLIAQKTKKLWQHERVYQDVELEQVLGSLKVIPDVSNIDPSEVLWTHRQTPDTDIYFISNQRLETVEIEPVFRVAPERQPEFWHADTGRIERMGQYDVTEAGTRVPIELGPAGSIFVVFRNPAAASALPVKPVLGKTLSVLELDEQDWTLEFMPGRDVPEQIELNPIAYWSESDDVAIVHYSGTATYKTEFNNNIEAKPHTQQVLDLGAVGEMARVHLNGQDLGLLWKPPFRLDVSNALKSGRNELAIEVTNHWSNRMLAELKQPDGFPSQAGHKELQPWISIPERGLGERTLDPSGIAGPIRIESFALQKESSVQVINY